MSVLGIVLLLFIGLLLILLEILILPGVGLTGIAGVVFLVFGVYISYNTFGNTTGNLVLAGTSLAIAVTLYFALKARTWRKLALNTEIDSKVNLINEQNIKVGDVGITISRLTPIGKVLINDEYVEARSKGSFIDPDTKIKVIRIAENKIFVDVFTEKNTEE